MKIYDEEDLIKSLLAFVKANLNTRITAINEEKDDSYSIETIKQDDRHYVFAGELLEIPNNIFVQCAVDGEIEVLNNYNSFASLPNVTIEVCFSDDKKPGTYFKSLRYMRALYETILEYEPSANEVGGLKITKVTPLAVTIRGNHFIVSGVTVSVSLS